MAKAEFVVVLLGLGLGVAPAFAESELELAVSADAVTVDYRQLDQVRGTSWGVGGLYNDDGSAWLVSGTFNVVGHATQASEVHTGLGFKAVAHDAFETAGALGVGGFVQYQPVTLQGFGVEGQLYYAPNVLSLDSERYFDLFARITYDVHPQARVFVGWSQVSVKYENPVVDEVDLKQGFDLGFTLSF